LEVFVVDTISRISPVPDGDYKIPSIISHAAIKRPVLLVRPVVNEGIGLLICAEPVEVEFMIVIDAFEFVRC